MTATLLAAFTRSFRSAVPALYMLSAGCTFLGEKPDDSTNPGASGDGDELSESEGTGAVPGGTGATGGATDGGGAGVTGGSVGTGGAPGSGGGATTGGSGSGAAPGGGGTSGTGGAPSGTEPFKGIAQNGDCEDLSLVGATWFYNWGLGTNCNPQNGAEYIPMVWGAGAVENVQQAVDGGHSTLLGFNEPDRGDQANMSVGQALSLWPALEGTGLRLGSPATASSPEGEAWLAEFMNQAESQGRRVDFVAVHWYGWGSGGCDDIHAHFTGYMERIMDHGLPVWLTEWGCYDESPEDVRAFYSAAVEWMLARPQIERYAWFLTRAGEGEAAWNAQSLVNGGGALTALGQDYLASQARR